MSTRNVRMVAVHRFGRRLRVVRMVTVGRWHLTAHCADGQEQREHVQHGVDGRAGRPGADGFPIVGGK